MVLKVWALLSSKKGFGIKPILIGGEQERGARAGTENVHNIAGMHKALELCYADMENDTKYLRGLKSYFIEQLKSLNSGISFNGCSRIR